MSRQTGHFEGEGAVEAGKAPLTSRTASPEARLIAAELLPAFYDQLKHIAQRARSRLGGYQTLQTTALVHEAYLRLRHSAKFTDETHFLRAAALAMRHALINYAAARVAEKRGGDTRGRIVDQRVAHGERCRAQEVSLIRELRGMPQAQVSLVNQGRSLQCLIATEPRARALRNVFELIVEGGEQLGGNEPGFRRGSAARQRRLSGFD